MRSPLLSRFWGAVALSATLVPAAAMAQLKPEVQTGSRIPVKPEAVERREAGEIKKAFGQCVYRQNPKAAIAVLMHGDMAHLDFEAAKIKDLSDTFEMPICLGNQAGMMQSALAFKFKREFLLIMLSEEAYLARYRVAPTLPVGATEAIEREYVSLGDDLTTARALGMFADCVVFSNMAGSDALLRTMPASPAELSAAKALTPALGACLPQGAKISFTPESIRGYVADGLWNRFVRPHAAARP